MQAMGWIDESRTNNRYSAGTYPELQERCGVTYCKVTFMMACALS